MDAKGKEAPKQYQKKEYTLDELLDLYNKGFQLVSFGETRVIEVPGAGTLTIRKYPSGAEYCVKSSGAMERINTAWFQKIERLVKEEQKQNAKKADKQFS